MKLRKEKVKKLFEKSIAKVKKIKNLKGGLSNDLFLINGVYVWRVFMNSLLDHKNEIVAMNELDYFSIHYTDKDNICYEFIEGNNIDRASFKLRVKSVFKELKKVHKLKIKTPHVWFDLIPKWLLQINNVEIRKRLKVQVQKINDKLIALKTDNDNVFCHNDLISANVLFKEKKCFIIDWEFAGRNFYFYELGNMICEYCIDYEREEYNFAPINLKLINRFISDYDRDDDVSQEANVKKVKLGIEMSHLFWSIYSYAKLENPNEFGFDYLKFAKSRFSQLK